MASAASGTWRPTHRAGAYVGCLGTCENSSAGSISGKLARGAAFSKPWRSLAPLTAVSNQESKDGLNSASYTFGHSSEAGETKVRRRGGMERRVARRAVDGGALLYTASCMLALLHAGAPTLTEWHPL